MRSSKNRSRNKNRNRPQGGNVINRVFDSSGPEGKVRGTPQQIIDKYTQLARDAQLAGDRVAVENFQQHAEHYTRMLAEAQKEVDAKREQQDREHQARQDRERAEREARREQQDRDEGRQDGRNDGRQDGERSDDGDRRSDDRRQDRQGDRADDRRAEEVDQGRGAATGDGEERKGRRGGNRRRKDRDDPAAADQSGSDALDLRGGEAGGPIEVPEAQSDAATQPAEDEPKPRRRRARKPNNDPRDAEGGEAAGQETAAE